MSSSNTNSNSIIIIKKYCINFGLTEEEILQLERRKEYNFFEYSHSQQSYSKVIDSKLLYDGSITEELVQDWIEELKEADILDEDGNLIYVEF